MKTVIRFCVLVHVASSVAGGSRCVGNWSEKSFSLDLTRNRQWKMQNLSPKWLWFRTQNTCLLTSFCSRIDFSVLFIAFRCFCGLASDCHACKAQFLAFTPDDRIFFMKQPTIGQEDLLSAKISIRQ